MEKMMAHYLSVLLVVKDQEAMAEYLKVGAAAVAKHEGRPFAGGPETKVLQEAHAPTKGVVLEFPSAQHAENWLSDPDLADIHALRNKGADVTILSLPSMA
jgi:uncharacterized protein (DUF1330 family)